MQITMKQPALPLAIYVAVIWHKIGRVLPMTLGYESYIIVIVRKYNLRKFLKIAIFLIFYTCLYYERTKQGRDRLCIGKNTMIIQVKKAK